MNIELQKTMDTLSSVGLKAAEDDMPLATYNIRMLHAHSTALADFVTHYLSALTNANKEELRDAFDVKFAQYLKIEFPEAFS